MASDEAFALYDCSLVRRATGRTISNLRELLDALRSVDVQVIEHHMVRCALEDHFELYEFPNDLARWCWDGLSERDLAEELALINPYAHVDLEEVRGSLVDLVESHIWKVERTVSSRTGLELCLVQSRLVAFDTGERYASLAALMEGLQRITRRSLFYHIHEAHRRRGCDDFSAWLEQQKQASEVVEQLRCLDFYSLNLTQLRAELLEILGRAVAEPQAVLGNLA